MKRLFETWLVIQRHMLGARTRCVFAPAERPDAVCVDSVDMPEQPLLHIRFALVVSYPLMSVWLMLRV